jgi:hypothetical protein
MVVQALHLTIGHGGIANCSPTLAHSSLTVEAEDQSLSFSILFFLTGRSSGSPKRHRFRKRVFVPLNSCFLVHFVLQNGRGYSALTDTVLTVTGLGRVMI